MISWFDGLTKGTLIMPRGEKEVANSERAV
jgi:hypothetical protein